MSRFDELRTLWPSLLSKGSDDGLQGPRRERERPREHIFQSCDLLPLRTLQGMTLQVIHVLILVSYFDGFDAKQKPDSHAHMSGADLESERTCAAPKVCGFVAFLTVEFLAVSCRRTGRLDYQKCFFVISRKKAVSLVSNIIKRSHHSII